MNNAVVDHVLSEVKSQLKKVDEPDKPNIDLSAYEIRADQSHSKAAPVLQVVDGQRISTIASRSDISTVIGKAKSKKTFLVTLLVAAVLRGEISNIRGSIATSKRRVLYFDTEMSNYHVHQVSRRLAKLVNDDWVKHPESIKIYALRALSPAERIKVIEYEINRSEDVAIVIIDGIRDLVTSINDEEQATEIATHLLKWSKLKDLHIMTVLHQNKGDTNARGHLGTELVNKSETVLSVAKIKDTELSEVKAEFCRNLDFKPFAFGVDSEGLPYIEEDYEFYDKRKGAKSLSSPANFQEDELYQLLLSSFNEGEEKSQNQSSLGLGAAMAVAGTKLSKRKSDEFIVFAYHKGMLNLREDGQKKLYSINPKYTDESE